MKKIVLSLSIALMSIACNHEKDKYHGGEEDALSTYPVGTNYVEVGTTIDSIYDNFVKGLRGKSAVSVIAELDHAKNAESVGLAISPAKVVFFGNPKLGTPIMQKNQLAGIDLPQKVLFYRTDEEKSIVMYNSIEYLRSRHGLVGVKTLDKMAQALESMTGKWSESEVKPALQQRVANGEGIITKNSNKDFANTLKSLRSALQANPKISILFELDHQKNAGDMTLNPTTLIVFGNPELGTPLMLDAPTVALDLPQRMLVWEDSAGSVFVSFNDPQYLADRHKMHNSDDVLTTIKMALDRLSDEAIK